MDTQAITIPNVLQKAIKNLSLGSCRYFSFHITLLLIILNRENKLKLLSVCLISIPNEILYTKSVRIFYEMCLITYLEL